MKKNCIPIILSLIAAFLLIASFPLRDSLGNTILSDLCRLSGFILLFVLSALRLSQSKN